MIQSSTSEHLIDEDLIRRALRGYGPNLRKFTTTIRDQIDQRSRQDASAAVPLNHSRWSRIAASIIPLQAIQQLVGPSTTSVTNASLATAKLSLTAKILAAISFPVVALFLMLGATAFGMFRIRRSAISTNANADLQRSATQAVSHWWRGELIAQVSLAFLIFAALWFNLTWCIYVVFFVSGCLTVTLISMLARTGQIDRRQIANCLIPSLIFLIQPLMMLSHHSIGLHIIDPMATVLVLILGTIGLALYVRFTCKNQTFLHKDAMTFLLVISFALFIGLSNSFWWPISQNTIKSNVENFDKAPYKSADWQHWSIGAQWLRDNHVQLDLSKPKSFLEKSLATEINPLILAVAFENGLIDAKRVAELVDLQATKRRCLSPYSRDQLLMNVSQQSFQLESLYRLEELSNQDVDFLKHRLLLTLQTNDRSTQQLDEIVAILRLLKSLGRPCEDPKIFAQLRSLLVSFQRTQPRAFQQTGGFALYPTLPFPDLKGTCDGIELMQLCGIPDDLDVIALRSFLVPIDSDRFVVRQGIMKAVARQQLSAIDDVPKVRWFDYLIYEHGILMACLTIALCFYALKVAPVQQSRSLPTEN